MELGYNQKWAHFDPPSLPAFHIEPLGIKETKFVQTVNIRL